MSVSGSCSSSTRELDPLLKDLSEKKQNFRRNVVSLAAELKDVRSRLASQEHLFTREALTRQAQTRARDMEEEILVLQECLEERNGLLLASASKAEQYLKELDDVRTKFSITQEAADENASSAQSAQLQCLALLKEVDEKNTLLKEHEDRVNKLGEQLDHLQKDLQEREVSQNQLRDEVLRIEHDIMLAVAKAGASKDSDLRRILEEVSPKNIEKMNKHLTAKDEEIAKLRDEIRFMSAHWKLKAKDLESQLEKHRRTDQELKKRVLKLEFCLQEARSQTRKLQRRIVSGLSLPWIWGSNRPFGINSKKTGERRDKALKELKDQLATKQQEESGNIGKENFWESSGFKLVVSMSMLILVVFAKR
ncbi:hypothetical protein IFM89_016307 [Coptis chinensis]|uniref:Uncharacterized protein n=1 Tax=Coptis chinensis TaxID=261450 RepID=A0A835H5L4_9MAGN|nr:hypothetical protein IFM89_016307 [Coptis chinensis]